MPKFIKLPPIEVNSSIIWINLEAIEQVYTSTEQRSFHVRLSSGKIFVLDEARAKILIAAIDPPDRSDIPF